MAIVKLTKSTAVLLFLSSSLQAQTSIDVSQITCEQFNFYKVADPQRIAIWLSGYYHGKRNDPILEKQRLEEDVDKLISFCYSNEKLKLFEAVEKVVDKK